MACILAPVPRCRLLLAVHKEARMKNGTNMQALMTWYVIVVCGILGYVMYTHP